jgi:protein-disulfide isomerase
MSRKTNRNLPSPPSLQPPAGVETRANRVKRRNLFVGSVLVLFLAFAAAAMLYRSEHANSGQLAAAKNHPGLASTHSPNFGHADAKVHIVEFLDPACETCAAFFPHVKALMSAHPGKVRLSLRHVPFHRGSDLVVRILEASRTQDKYLATLEALYASQRVWTVHHEVQPDRAWQSVGGVGLDLGRLSSDMSDPEVASRMAQDLDDARVLGVTKTPEFFVNGRPLPSFGLEQLQDLLSEELRRAYR